MKVITGVNAGGTSLQGYLENVSFWELIDIFGEPEGPSGDGKTRVNWSIKFEQDDSTMQTATIYDWKTDEPLSEVRKWNVGGNDVTDFDVLNSFVQQKLSEFKKIEYCTPGSDCQV